VASQAKIHKLAHSKWPEDRLKAARLLESEFLALPDSNQAWQDIHELIQDEYFFVREAAAGGLKRSLSLESVKDIAWEDLHMLIQDELSEVRRAAVDAIRSTFIQIPNRNQAWRDLVSRTDDESLLVREAAAQALTAAFIDVPDKDSAWRDLRVLIQHQYPPVRKEAIETIGSVFGQIPDKDQAFKDLHKLIKDESHFVRESAAKAIISAFSHIPDKDSAWQVLNSLMQDDRFSAKSAAIKALGSSFSQISNKDRIWKDLTELAQNKDRNLRRAAADVLKTTLGQLLDKDQAWRYLHDGLTPRTDAYVWRAAAYALGSAFSQFKDKDVVWKDLISLARKDDYSVKGAAALSIISAFCQVQNKERAWNDIHELIMDKDINILKAIAFDLGASFSQVPNKDQAWQDLVRLANSNGKKCDYVRAYANHSLGKISIYRALVAINHEDLKNELKNAIKYFEEASKELSVSNNPAKFCLPFYRCYFAITFENAQESEVKSYLTEAKQSVRGSEIKDDLLYSLEYLFKALLESQKLKNKSLDKIANELNDYSQYCHKAQEHMIAAEKNAPGTIGLMKKCNPLLEGKIKANIAEIQEKVKQIYKITTASGNQFENFGIEISQAAESLYSDNIGRAQQSIFNITSRIKELCEILPKDRRALVCRAIEEVHSTKDLPEKIEKLEQALEYTTAYIRISIENYEKRLADIVILTILPEEYAAVCRKLDGLRVPTKNELASNRYAWKLGNVISKQPQKNLTLAVGMIGRPGNIQSALATFEAILQWRPIYVFLVGIAGGFSDFNKGDIAIANIVHGYEYGKIDEGFRPRDDWTYQVDLSLKNSATDYSLGSDWHRLIDRDKKPPSESTSKPKALCVDFGSGDKIVDNPNDPFFARVLERWSSVKAVEMEGVGASNAIQHVKGLCTPYSEKLGFMMIRGISDLPRSENENEIRGTKERDAWKTYAADTAAAFTVGWIANGLPLNPGE